MYLSPDHIGGEVLVVLGALDDHMEVKQADERDVNLVNFSLLTCGLRRPMTMLMAAMVG